MDVYKTCYSILMAALSVMAPGDAPESEEEQGEISDYKCALLSSSATGEALPQESLNEMVANLMKFLLLKYQAKELTSQAEMLKKVLRDNQEHFPVVLRQAS
ncbi:unnamed protein product [Rangifer tarandus platyrhynchus]|uniref:MAGE domain-containing protein n=1 Tax=Rangifer tarandus platyrhynchus TaxID=3082113 RepID=A0ABN9A6F5_RANTA|nr:unnamed protein product [Rangifer tarandus platyrhynchus]